MRMLSIQDTIARSTRHDNSSLSVNVNVPFPLPYRER